MNPIPLKNENQTMPRRAYSVPRLLLVVAAWCLSAPAWLTGVDLVLTLGEHSVPLFVILLFAVWHLAWWLTVGYWVCRRWYASLWGLALLSALVWGAMSPHWAVVAWPMHLVLWVMALDKLLGWFTQRRHKHGTPQ